MYIICVCVYIYTYNLQGERGSLYMCVCVCVCIYVYIYTYIYIYTHVLAKFSKLLEQNKEGNCLHFALKIDFLDKKEHEDNKIISDKLFFQIKHFL
jgi:hypothetical protein